MVLKEGLDVSELFWGLILCGCLLKCVGDMEFDLERFCEVPTTTFSLHQCTALPLLTVLIRMWVQHLCNKDDIRTQIASVLTNLGLLLY